MKSLISFFILVLSVALFFWYIVPNYRVALALRADHEVYASALEQAKQAGLKRADLVNRYNSFSTTDLNRLNMLMPDKTDEIQLLVDLNAMADKYGTGISTIRVVRPESGTGRIVTPNQQDPYGTLEIEFSTSMSYANFLLFLEDLEKNLKLVDVSSIKFIPTDSGATYDFNLVLKTYWLK